MLLFYKTMFAKISGYSAKADLKKYSIHFLKIFISPLLLVFILSCSLPQPKLKSKQQTKKQAEPLPEIVLPEGANRRLPSAISKQDFFLAIPTKITAEASKAGRLMNSIICRIMKFISMHKNWIELNADSGIFRMVLSANIRERQRKNAPCSIL